MKLIEEAAQLDKALLNRKGKSVNCWREIEMRNRKTKRQLALLTGITENVINIYKIKFILINKSQITSSFLLYVFVPLLIFISLLL
jgi:hypothetical protein